MKLTKTRSVTMTNRDFHLMLKTRFSSVEAEKIQVLIKSCFNKTNVGVFDKFCMIFISSERTVGDRRNGDTADNIVCVNHKGDDIGFDIPLTRERVGMFESITMNTLDHIFRTEGLDIAYSDAYVLIERAIIQAEYVLLKAMELPEGMTFHELELVHKATISLTMKLS